MSWSLGSKTQSFDVAGAFLVYGWTFYIPDPFLGLAFFLLVLMHVLLRSAAAPRVQSTPSANFPPMLTLPTINDDIVRRIQEMEAAALHNRRH